MIDQGLVIAEGTSDELKAQVGGDRLEIRLEERGRDEEAIAALAPIADERPFCENGQLRVPLRERRGSIAEAVRRLDEAGIGIDDIAVRTPTLDDVFLSLTGHAAESERGRRKPHEHVPARRLGHGRAGEAEPQAHPASARPADRLHRAADHVRAAVRLRLRRRDRDARPRLRRLPDARDHRAVDGLRRLRHRARTRRGPEEGPDRPLPLAPDVGTGGARRAGSWPTSGRT